MRSVSLGNFISNHHQWRDLPLSGGVERPIICTSITPCTPISRQHVCTYSMCQYECVCGRACVAKLWEKKGMGRHREETAYSQLQYPTFKASLISLTQPLYFVGWMFMFIASEHGSVGECACVWFYTLLEIASTHPHKIRASLSQRSLSSDLRAQTSIKMVMGTYLLYLRWTLMSIMAWHDLSGY